MRFTLHFLVEFGTAKQASYTNAKIVQFLILLQLQFSFETVYSWLQLYNLILYSPGLLFTIFVKYLKIHILNLTLVFVCCCISTTVDIMIAYIVQKLRKHAMGANMCQTSLNPEHRHISMNDWCEKREKKKMSLQQV